MRGLDEAKSMSEHEDEVAKELREIYEAAMAYRPDPDRAIVRGKASEILAERAKKKAASKRQVTARFDQEVVEEFKRLAGEGSYQRLMNQALREWLQSRQMEEVIRKVMREELEQALKKSA